jgi:hypothetical protein
MKITVSSLKKYIHESMLNEIDIENVQGITCVAGSTHIMNTCKIGKDKYFLKFSDEELFESGDPSLQILVEYLAYKIYQLYPSVSVPNVQLVFDKTKRRVGLASSSAKGKSALGRIDSRKLGKMLSAGVYVDIFLANWDVIGIGTGNVFSDGEKATRIDPGGSLTFRAQGGRKGSKFSSDPGELKTMLNPDFGAGEVLSYSDMKVAATEFNSVGWGTISNAIKSASDEISEELENKNMLDLLDQWQADVSEITSKLAKRHVAIKNHIKKSV